jgi:hypothetical protein
MFATMRALLLALVPALAGCTCDPPSKPAARTAAGSGSARAPARSGEGSGSEAGSAAAAGSAGAAAGSACTTETAIRVSRILTDPAHPCRARIQAAYGRMVRVGDGASGTIVSAAAARGAGLLVTCRTCAGIADAEGAGVARLEGGAWLADPAREPPLAFRVGAPARLAGGAVPGGPLPYAALGLFGTDDVTLAALGAPREPAGAQPAGAPPAGAGDARVTLDDPSGLAASRAPFVDVRPGATALVLGFADAEGGELVASVGPVLDEAEAHRLIARAGARPGHDPRTELAIAARAVPGMVGGGVFDEAGRFVGVVTGTAAAPDGGEHLVRAVRATSIAARLSAALRAAPVPLRVKILPFLP